MIYDKKEILDYIHQLNPEALVPVGLEEAVVGYVERFSDPPLVLLDKEKCIEILMNDNMSREDALSYFEYNILGSWMGEGTPCFATILTKDCV
jgi:hypothetical protein